MLTPLSAQAPTRPPERYGAPQPWVRWLTILLVVALGLSGSAWLLWAALYHADPQVGARLVGFRVVDAHHVDVTIQVDRASGAPTTALSAASASTRQVVGDVTFVVPPEAPSSVIVTPSVRTERRAVNAVLYGCTTPAQPQPR